MGCKPLLSLSRVRERVLETGGQEKCLHGSQESPFLTLNFVTIETYTNITAERACQNQGTKGLGQNTQVLSSLIYIV